ncbi:hypothetical protein H4582DRAFT_2131765 [Lactarius indigo]|nr:hypothetical protein H4582DRAFT_2131765 [Lactarius indigo]
MRGWLLGALGNTGAGLEMNWAWMALQMRSRCKRYTRQVASLLPNGHSLRTLRLRATLATGAVKLEGTRELSS